MPRGSAPGERRGGRQKGTPNDKPMRDALMLELHQDIEIDDPQTKRKIKIKKYRLVMRALVNAAIRGDIAAIREVNERSDGKVAQEHRGPGAGGAFTVYDPSKVSDAELDVLERIARAGSPVGGHPR